MTRKSKNLNKTINDDKSIGDGIRTLVAYLNTYSKINSMEFKLTCPWCERIVNALRRQGKKRFTKTDILKFYYETYEKHRGNGERDTKPDAKNDDKEYREKRRKTINHHIKDHLLVDGFLSEELGTKKRVVYRLQKEILYLQMALKGYNEFKEFIDKPIDLLFFMIFFGFKRGKDIYHLKGDENYDLKKILNEKLTAVCPMCEYNGIIPQVPSKYRFDKPNHIISLFFVYWECPRCFFSFKSNRIDILEITELLSV